jgi:hypothetical protein
MLVCFSGIQSIKTGSACAAKGVMLTTENENNLFIQHLQIGQGLYFNALFIAS